MLTLTYLPSIKSLRKTLLNAVVVLNVLCLSTWVQSEGLDQGFYKKLGVTPVMNKWGVSELSAGIIELMSDKFKRVDKTCRRENNIEDEPRPN